MALVSNTTLVLFFCLFFGYAVTEFNFNFQSDNEHVEGIYQRCSGWCNEKYCKIYSSCRPINRTSKLKRLDIHFHNGVKLEAPILFHVITYKKFTTQYRPHMINVKMEFCDFVSQRNHAIFKFFAFGTLNGTLIDPCPLSGHRYHAPMYTTGWVATIIPVGEWRVDFSMVKVINGVDERILNVSYYILVKAKGATEF